MPAFAVPYMVRPGDSFSSISRSWRSVSEEDLRLANPRIDPKNLLPGMILEVPSITPSEHISVIAERDALSRSLASSREVVEELKKATHQEARKARLWERRSQRANDKLMWSQRLVRWGFGGWALAITALAFCIIAWSVQARALSLKRHAETKEKTLKGEVDRLRKSFASQVTVGRLALDMSPEEFAAFQGLLSQLFAAFENQPDITERVKMYLRSRSGNAGVIKQDRAHRSQN